VSADRVIGGDRQAGGPTPTTTTRSPMALSTRSWASFSAT
jgi:hypothetical protein